MTKTSRDREHGQTLVLFGLLLAVLIGFVALTVDVGLILYNRADNQKTADAAALAAAQELPDAASALVVAEQYLEANGFDPSDPDHSYEITTPYQGDAEKIEVTISADVGLFFGRVLNLDFVEVPARAVAGANLTPPTPLSDASIITLSQSKCKSLEVNASSNFTAMGPIMINSDCDLYAAEFGCSTNCNAAAGIQSVGGVKIDGTCDPCNVTTIGHFADPFAGVLPPCFPNSPAPCQNVGPLTVRHGTAGSPLKLTTGESFQPGIYYGGIDVAPSSAATFEPGIYIMAGGGFKVNSSASLTANGIFIYNTENPDVPFGDGQFQSVTINTNAAASFSAMNTGPYAGLLFFQDRDNAEKAVFNPNSSFGSGTIYFPAALVDLNPNASSALQIVADTVKINNSGAFVAEFDGEEFFSGDASAVIRLIE